MTVGSLDAVAPKKKTSTDLTPEMVTASRLIRQARAGGPTLIGHDGLAEAVYEDDAADSSGM